jgi:hypothetical protein
MKPYYQLSCNSLEEIQKEVIDWIRLNNPEILHSKSLWNKTDTVNLLRSTPALIEYCRSLDLKLREVALTIVTEKKNVDLHIDELPITAKINIPILNTRNTFNRWYNIPSELFSATTPIINEFGKKFYNFKDVDYSKLDLLGEIELLSPVVFNSQIAHNIILGEHSVLPRIVLSCTFFKEPLHYLKD